MDDKTFDILYADALHALSERHLLDALDALGGLTAGNNGMAGQRFIQLREDCARNREDYARMLDYWQQGVEDPEREELFNQFLQTTSELLEACRYHHLTMGTSSFFSGLRQRVQDETDGEGELDRLFNRIYTAPPFDSLNLPFSEDDEKLAKDILLGEEAPLSQRLVVASALTLSALQVLDERRISLLLEGSAPSKRPTSLRARCLVGAVLALLRHVPRLYLYPRLEAQLQILTEDPAFVADLQLVQLQFLLSARTKQDDRKMRDEIIPEMMRAAERIKPLQEMDFSRMEEIEMELNPEWNADGSTSEMRKRINELLALQEKGADTFFSTFAHIVRQHAFWNEAAHWFVPFSFDNPAFGSRGELYSHLQFIFKNRPVSDTEKYAMTFSLTNLAEGQLRGLGEGLRKLDEQHREMMENLAHEDEVLGEENGSGGGTEDPRAAMRQAVRFCVQDLYRYFHLFRFRNEKDNPFQQNLDLARVPGLTAAMQRNDSLQAFAAYCFAESSWGEALHYFRLLQENERDATTYEKMGYCCSMEKDYELAAECFERANMIRPDSPWTLRQLAKMRTLTGDYDLAMEALHELERLQPEDEDTLLRLGECLLHLGDTAAALEKLYKADYLKPEGRARRALAWCFLTTGQTEQAADYYQRILNADNATAEDYYNGGHCAWIAGDIPEAVARYVKAVQLRGEGKAGTDFFNEDRSLLRKAGKTDNELLLMRDAINHSIK